MQIYSALNYGQLKNQSRKEENRNKQMYRKPLKHMSIKKNIESNRGCGSGSGGGRSGHIKRSRQV